MKKIVVATALAVLAGCANLPDSIKHPFAARGATAQSGTTTPADAVSPYPYNSPYGQ